MIRLPHQRFAYSLGPQRDLPWRTRSRGDHGPSSRRSCQQVSSGTETPAGIDLGHPRYLCCQYRDVAKTAALHSGQFGIDRIEPRISWIHKLVRFRVINCLSDPVDPCLLIWVICRNDNGLYQARFPQSQIIYSRPRWNIDLGFLFPRHFRCWCRWWLRRRCFREFIFQSLGKGFCFIDLFDSSSSSV